MTLIDKTLVYSYLLNRQDDCPAYSMKPSLRGLNPDRKLKDALGTRHTRPYGFIGTVKDLGTDLQSLSPLRTLTGMPNAGRRNKSQEEYLFGPCRIPAIPGLLALCPDDVQIIGNPKNHLVSMTCS